MYTRTYPLYYLTVLPPFLLHTFPSSYCPSIAYCHPLSFPPSLPSPATLPITPPLLPSSSPFSLPLSLTYPLSYLTLLIPSLPPSYHLILPPCLLPSHPSSLLLLVSQLTVLDQQMDLSEGEASTSMMMRDYCIAEKKAGKIRYLLLSHLIYYILQIVFIIYSYSILYYSIFIRFAFVFRVNE